MTVLPLGLQLTWDGAAGRSPGLLDRHGGDPVGVGDGADGAAPGDPVQDAGLANFLLIHEYALLSEKNQILFHVDKIDFKQMEKDTYQVCSKKHIVILLKHSLHIVLITYPVLLTVEHCEHSLPIANNKNSNVDKTTNAD